MIKKFICKKGASNYYLVNEGMGGFLNPPVDIDGTAVSFQQDREGTHTPG